MRNIYLAAEGGIHTRLLGVGGGAALSGAGHGGVPKQSSIRSALSSTSRIPHFRCEIRPFFKYQGVSRRSKSEEEKECDDEEFIISGNEGGNMLTVKSIRNHHLVGNRFAHLQIPERLCKRLVMIGSRRLTD